MPRKTGYVFQAWLSSEDESSDDEIEIIPYVKPHPEVIDLVESADPEMLMDSSQPTGVSQKGNGAPAANGDLGGKDLSSDRNEGPQIVASSTSRGGQAQSVGPINAVIGGGSTFISNLDNNSITMLPPANVLADKGTPGYGSNFNKCNNAKKRNNKEAANTATSPKTGMGMVGAPLFLPVERSTPVRKNQGSQAKRQPKSTAKAQGVRRPRVRKSRVTQMANEEIYYFLSTLGIDLDHPITGTPEAAKAKSRLPRNSTSSSTGNDTVVAPTWRLDPRPSSKDDKDKTDNIRNDKVSSIAGSSDGNVLRDHHREKAGFKAKSSALNTRFPSRASRPHPPKRSRYFEEAD